MPHEGPLDLVRLHPEIAVDLVRATTDIELPDSVIASVAPTHMSAVIPEYEKTFIERIHDQGIAEGEAKGKAEAVLKLLDARNLAPSPDQRNQVKTCSDPAQLDLWFDRAITASTVAEVFEPADY
jgi:hypothetical protein